MDLLLIIRGIAAITVLVWHAVGYAGGWALMNTPGRTAVWVFFGISGYVIAHGFTNNKYKLNALDLRYYFLNRILRIYPLFLLLSFLGWLTIYIKTGESPVEWRSLIWELLPLQFNHEYTFNGVFWTLGLEMQFYLLAPILAMPLIFENRILRWTVILGLYSLCLTLIDHVTGQRGWSFDGRNIIMVLPHFLVGMIGCRLVFDIRVHPRLGSAALCIALLLLMFSNWIYHSEAKLFWSIWGILIIDLMILSAIVAHAYFAGGGQPHSIFARVFEWLGVVSYGIYAWHAYLMATFDWARSSLFALGGGTLLLSFLTYRLVEMPALRQKRWRQ